MHGRLLSTRLQSKIWNALIAGILEENPNWFEWDNMQNMFNVLRMLCVVLLQSALFVVNLLYAGTLLLYNFSSKLHFIFKDRL